MVKRITMAAAGLMIVFGLADAAFGYRCVLNCTNIPLCERRCVVFSDGSCGCACA
jgi:hypothetical protein